jgi:uncharacterized membrane protein YozB (DUF420 family)
MAISDLPALNATLNAIAATLLATGWVLIRRGRIAHVGSRPFSGQGPIRAVYFAILISHIVLAAAILPLSIVTLSRALAARYDRHRRIARWTLPIWLYVSVTGVVVYLMLYQL